MRDEEEVEGDPASHEATADIPAPQDATADTAPDPAPQRRACDGGAEWLDGARVIRNRGREVQVAPTSAKRFDTARRRVFLEWFAGTGNLSLSAREAGIGYKTVIRHRIEDEGFAADFDQALAQSRVRLRAWVGEAKDDGRTEYDPEAHAPAHLDSEQVLRLLREEDQREAAAQRRAEAAAGLAVGGGGRGGRPLKRADMERVRAELVERLEAMGIELSEEEKGAPLDFARDERSQDPPLDGARDEEAA